MCEVGQLAAAVPAFEAAAGGLVDVRHDQGRKGDALEVQRTEVRRGPRGLLVVVPAVAPAFDGEARALEADVAVSELPSQQGEELERKVGGLDECELGSAIAHAYV